MGVMNSKPSSKMESKYNLGGTNRLFQVKYAAKATSRSMMNQEL